MFTRQGAVEVLGKVGRGWLYFLAFAIPLAFCRETMYVFQAKTLLLQYGGLSLLLLIVGHSLLNKGQGQEVWRERTSILMIIFLAWQIWKSHDSIAPVLSWQESSRVFWLPMIALAVPYFFRDRSHVLLLVRWVVVSAVLANIFAWCCYSPFLKAAIFGISVKSNHFLLDLYDVPLLGNWLKTFFYPQEFLDTFQRKLTLKLNNGEPVFPLTSYSFFPGKDDAGTFGNKNFLAAYLNLTSPFVFFMAMKCSLAVIKNPAWSRAYKIFLGALSMLLLSIVFGSLWHLVELQTRGAWVGFGAGLLSAGIYAICFVVPQNHRAKAAIGLCLLLVMSGATLSQLSPSRFQSIFSASHGGSNELRSLTWAKYTQAWWGDREWSGFEGDAHRILTGFGQYTFRVVYPKVRSPRIFNIEFNQHNTETSHAHNEYLSYCGELGLVGLGLYLLLLLALVGAFWRRSRNFKGGELFLGGVIVFALASQLAHQGLEVSVRYTGVAFQLWLTLGLMLALTIQFNKVEPRLSGTSKSTAKWSRFPAAHLRWMPLFLLAMSFMVMPHWLWPLRWFSSQHDFEMGQIYFGSVREAQQQASELQQTKSRLAQMMQNVQQRKLPLPEGLKKEVQACQDKDQRLTRMLKFYGPLAHQYFQAAYRLDAGNFECLYIDAIMNVQLANGALMQNNPVDSKRFYELALQNYETIENTMPYFVQLHYWKGLCWKGLAVIETDAQKAEKNFKLALESLNQYAKQDPYFKDLFLDRYFCYARLQQKDQAVDQLVQYLLSLEKSGEPLFDEQRRYDSQSILEAILKDGDSQLVERAQAILVGLMDHRASTCLLPFVPKTDRHIKNSFRILREPTE